VKEIKYN